MKAVAEMLDHDARWHEPRFVKWTGPGEPQPVQLWESHPRRDASYSLHYANFGGTDMLLCPQEDGSLVVSKVFLNIGGVEDLSAGILRDFGEP